MMHAFSSSKDKWLFCLKVVLDFLDLVLGTVDQGRRRYWGRSLEDLEVFSFFSTSRFCRGHSSWHQSPSYSFQSRRFSFREALVTCKSFLWDHEPSVRYETYWFVCEIYLLCSLLCSPLSCDWLSSLSSSLQTPWWFAPVVLLGVWTCGTLQTFWLYWSWAVSAIIR